MRCNEARVRKSLRGSQYSLAIKGGGTGLGAGGEISILSHSLERTGFGCFGPNGCQLLDANLALLWHLFFLEMSVFSILTSGAACFRFTRPAVGPIPGTLVK